MKIIGHRGASGYEPENTLSSFSRALELGVDAIELDVYALNSGELVVIHDDKVDRTTNGKGYVLNYTFEALRKLDAGKGQTIPTLNEVLDLVDKKTVINIEIKGMGIAEPVANIVAGYLEKGWPEDRFIISTFNHIDLAAFKKLLPSVRIGALIVGVPLGYTSFAVPLEAYSVHPKSEFITQEFVDDAKSRGVKVFAFTVNERSEVERMKSLGVDGIFTDFPDKARKYLG